MVWKSGSRLSEKDGLNGDEICKYKILRSKKYIKMCKKVTKDETE